MRWRSLCLLLLLPGWARGQKVTTLTADQGTAGSEAWPVTVVAGSTTITGTASVSVAGGAVSQAGSWSVSATIVGPVTLAGTSAVSIASGAVSQAGNWAVSATIVGPVTLAGTSAVSIASGAVSQAGTWAMSATVSGPVTVRKEFSSRSDTYTAAANGTPVTLTTPLKYFALQVVQTGTVTTWDVRLEGSLDGATFGLIVAHTNVDGSGAVKVSAASPVAYFRSRCDSITLGGGTNVIAYIMGAQ